MDYTPLLFFIIPNGLSLVATLANLTITIRTKLLRNAVVKMIIWFSLMNILMQTCSFYVFLREYIVCERCDLVAAFLTYFGWIGALFWTICFGHSLYFSITRQEVDSLDSIWIYYWFGSIVLASAGGTFAVLFNFTILSSIYFMVEDISLIIYMLVLPSAMTILLSTILQVMVVIGVRSRGVTIKLELFIKPLILFICFAPLGLIASATSINEVRIYLASTAFYSQGLLTSLMFGLGKAIAELFKSSDNDIDSFLDYESSIGKLSRSNSIQTNRKETLSDTQRSRKSSLGIEETKEERIEEKIGSNTSSVKSKTRRETEIELTPGNTWNASHMPESKQNEKQNSFEIED